MAGIPSIVSISVVTPNFLRYAFPRLPGSAAVVDSALTDSSTPTWRIRAGNVLVLKTSTGRFVAANDATGDRNAPASISALEAASAAWNSLAIDFNLDGGVKFTVTLQAGTATNAAAVTDLNGNAVFAANLIADVSGGFVRIRTLRAGKNTYLLVNAAARAAAFGASGTSAKGTDADYRVLAQPVDLQDNSGAATHALGETLLAGAFKTANLLNLTNEAQEVLERLGANFG